MKKLGLVVGSLALATIGGVYANWVYLTDTDISVNHRIAAFGMTDITSGSAQVGAYSVEDNIATFEIDQKDTTTPDYTAVLVRAYTDSSNAPKITIKLTTNVGASADIVENGISALQLRLRMMILLRTLWKTLKFSAVHMTLIIILRSVVQIIPPQLINGKKLTARFK